MREEKLTRKLELLSLPDISLFNVYTTSCYDAYDKQRAGEKIKRIYQRVKCIYKRVHFLEIVSFFIVGAFFDRDNDRRIEICLNEDI